MKKLLKKTFFIISMVAVFIGGSWVRANEFDRHFTHVDDIGVASTILSFKQIPRSVLENRDLFPKPLIGILDPFYRITAVSRQWTYAPLQFFITYFLISPSQTYQNIIFWGRLPSLFFGIAGLAALIIFYYFYDRLRTASVLIGLTLMAFSWEHIIYSKQMQNYTMGTLAAIVLMTILIRRPLKRDPSMKGIVFLSVLLAFLCHAHYQMLFLMPAFFAAAFLDLLPAYKKRLGCLFAKFILLAGILSALLLPMYMLFLRRHISYAGRDWILGPHEEFRFTLSAHGQAWNHAAESILFFVKNWLIVFASDLAFLPETSGLYRPLLGLFFVLAVLGAWKLLWSRGIKRQLAGRFILFTFITWNALVLLDRFALSPTRHSLILLPLMLVLVTEGCLQLLRWIGSNWRAGLASYGHIVLALAVAVPFFVDFGRITDQRRGFFDEAEIEQVLDRYDVDTVIADTWTWNLSLMRGIQNKHVLIGSFDRMKPVSSLAGLTDPYRTIAFVSQWVPLNEPVFQAAKQRINSHPTLTVDHPNFELKGNLKDYQMVYSKEVSHNTCIDFSPRTQSGINGLFLYVLKKNNPPD